MGCCIKLRTNPSGSMWHRGPTDQTKAGMCSISYPYAIQMILKHQLSQAGPGHLGVSSKLRPRDSLHLCTL